jgi:hypothetical protein
MAIILHLSNLYSHFQIPSSNLIRQKAFYARPPLAWIWALSSSGGFLCGIATVWVKHNNQSDIRGILRKQDRLLFGKTTRRLRSLVIPARGYVGGVV